MKRKVKFQDGGQVGDSTTRRPSLITNEPVGTRLGRFLRNRFQRSQEQQDLVDAYRQQVPVDEIRRRRLQAEANAEAAGRAAPPAPAAPAPAPAPAAPAPAPAAPPASRAAQQTPPRPANRPRPRPRPAPAPAPAPRNSGERAPEGGPPVLSEADRLRAARAAEEAAALQMGGSGDIGAASARARGEQVGPPGDYNMKKGGIVKKKAGGMIAAKPKAAPKKMMKGGMVAKPKVAAKSKTKPMPFKKGGVIKKGKK